MLYGARFERTFLNLQSPVMEEPFALEYETIMTINNRYNREKQLKQFNDKIKRIIKKESI